MQFNEVQFIIHISYKVQVSQFLIIHHIAKQGMFSEVYHPG